MITILNGPNLDRLGTREPHIYGSTTLVELEAFCAEVAASAGHGVSCHQSNCEGELIGWIHEALDAQTAPDRCIGIVLNPAGLTHYSIALRDAVALATDAGLPVVEVHISQPAAREEFRHTSVISAVATGTIAGLGIDSYRLAIDHLLRRAAA